MAKEANNLRSVLDRIDPLSDEPLKRVRNDEDPLVELARIVSSGPLYPKSGPAVETQGNDNPYAPADRRHGDADDAPAAPPRGGAQPDQPGAPDYLNDEDVFAGDVTAGLEQELYAELAPAAEADTFTRTPDTAADPAGVAPIEEAPADPDIAEEAAYFGDASTGDVIDDVAAGFTPADTPVDLSAADLPSDDASLALPYDDHRDEPSAGQVPFTFVAVGSEPFDADDAVDTFDSSAETETEAAIPVADAFVDDELETAEADSAYDNSSLLDDDRFPDDGVSSPVAAGDSASLLSQLRQNFTVNDAIAADQPEALPYDADDIAGEPADAAETEPFDEADAALAGPVDVDAARFVDGEAAQTVDAPQSLDGDLEQALFDEIAEGSLDEPAPDYADLDGSAYVDDQSDGDDLDVDDPIAVALAEAIGGAVRDDAAHRTDPAAGDYPFEEAASEDADPGGFEPAPVFPQPVYRDEFVDDASLDAGDDFVPAETIAASPYDEQVQDAAGWRVAGAYAADEEPAEPEYRYPAEDVAPEPVVGEDHFDEDTIEPPRVAVDLDEAYGPQYASVDETGYAPFDADAARPFDDTFDTEADDYRDDQSIAAAAYETEPDYSDDDMLPPHPEEELAAVSGDTGPPRGLYVAAVLAGIVFVGFGGFFGYKFFAGAGDSGPPPVIVADKAPVKIMPDSPQKTADAARSKLIYDRVGGSDGAEERLVVRSEEPVEALGAQNAGATSATVDATGSPSAGRPALPRRVRTVVVRPDGTIINETPAADAGTSAPVETAPLRTASADDVRSETAMADTTAANGDIAAASNAEATAPINPYLPRPKPDLTAAASSAETETPSSADVPTETATAMTAPVADNSGDAAADTPVAASNADDPAAAPTEPAATAAADAPADAVTPTKTDTSKVDSAARKVKTKPIRTAAKTKPTPAARPAQPAVTAQAPAAQPATTAPRRVVTEPISTPSSVRPATPSGTRTATSRSGPLDLTSGGDAAAPAGAAAAPQQPAVQAPPAGTFSVQVSSQRSEAQAQAAYRALQKRYPDLLASRNAMILRADLGDRGTYYRVRVGPMARNDANTFCGNLKRRGGDCFIRRN